MRHLTACHCVVTVGALEAMSAMDTVSGGVGDRRDSAFSLWLCEEDRAGSLSFGLGAFDEVGSVLDEALSGVGPLLFLFQEGRGFVACEGSWLFLKLV